MLEDMRISSLRKHIQDRNFSVEELVVTVLEQVKAHESQLNAFITVVSEQALIQAKKVDRSIARGENISPLAGIPFTLKDNICTDDTRTTCASRMLENYVSPFNAVVQERLQQAGAILIGKTNLDEFALGTTTGTSYFGETSNPWNTNNIPGGSSGGTAASVAARQTAFGIGSDTGGSVRLPAAYCGTVGIKPTYGLIPTLGLIECAPSLEHLGVFSLDVASCASVLEIIGGASSDDPLSAEIKPPVCPLDAEESLSGLRIGVPTEYWPDHMDPGIKNTYEQNLQRLSALGAELEKISLPHTQYASAAYFVISAGEAFSNLSNFDGIRFGFRADAEHLQALYRRSRSEGFGEKVQQQLIFGAMVLGAQNYEELFVKAKKIRTLVIRDFDKAFQKIDLLVSPTAISTAPSKDKCAREDGLKLRLQDSNLLPANLAGIPALSIPVGQSSGLPLGLQFMGAPFSEARLLQAAYRLENEIAFWGKKPPIIETEG